MNKITLTINQQDALDFIVKCEKIGDRMALDTWLEKIEKRRDDTGGILETDYHLWCYLNAMINLNELITGMENESISFNREIDNMYREGINILLNLWEETIIEGGK